MRLEGEIGGGKQVMLLAGGGISWTWEDGGYGQGLLVNYSCVLLVGPRWDLLGSSYWALGEANLATASRPLVGLHWRQLMMGGPLRLLWRQLVGY